MLFKILNNDPFGDEAKFGPFVALVVHLIRMAWVGFLAVCCVMACVGALVLFAFFVKIIIMAFGLFLSPIPFLER